MKIIMLGAPGAGKGTQKEDCGEVRYPAHFQGDIFRANIKNGTSLGKTKSYMDQGLI